MGLSAVRDNFRGDVHGPAASEAQTLGKALGPEFSVAKIERLLDHFGDTATLANASLPQLNEILGNLGEARHLQAILQVASAIGRPVLVDHPVIANCEDLVLHLRGKLGASRVETFNVLFLDTHNRIIADEVLWTGTVSEVQIYPREIMRRALELDSSAFIAAHNHPSDVVTPSSADIEMTHKLLKAAQILGLTFHDHFIVSASNYHSMRFHKSIDPWA